MKAGNVDQLLRMLKPDDGMYGFYKLSNSDAEKLVKLYKDRGVLRGVSSLAEAKKILWESTYKGDRKDVYGADLIKSGALEVPGPLKGLSVKAIREKLTKHKMYSYTFRVSFEGNYKNAIKVLQQSLNISVTGRYTEDVARAVYSKIKGEIPKEKGYLASEDDPDRLFKSGFQEYVFCVDKVVWELCGVEEQWLKDDGHGIWTSTTALPVDNECQEALHYIEMYGVEEAKSLCSHRMKIRQIFTLGEKKAREILDELMKEGVYWENARYHNIKSSSYGEKFDNKVANEIESAQREQKIREAIPDIADTILNLVMLYMAQKSNFEQLAQSNSQAPAITMQALSEIAEEWAAQNSEPGGSLGDVLSLYIGDVDLSDIEKLQGVKEIVQKSEYNYLVFDSAKHLEDQFIELIHAELDENKNRNKYIYSSSKLETELYNTVIVDYLQIVLHINENSEPYREFLDPFLE